MAQASDYPVSFPFGATTAPYSTSKPHLGDDRAMPVSTPVIVNGLTIGLSGSTGLSTGPHLHVGRWVGGVATDPGRAGFTLPNATVYDTGSDATNGNYVRISSGGALWCYLHLSQINVTKGQAVLPTATHPAPQGVEMIATRDEAVRVYQTLRPNGGPSQDELDNTIGKRSYAQFFVDAIPELGLRNDGLLRKDAQIGQLQTAIAELNTKVAQLTALHQSDEQDSATKAAQIASLQAAIAGKNDEIARRVSVITASTAKTTPDVTPTEPGKQPWFVNLLAALIAKK